MLKKTISYEDYNGEKQNEDFYFNLNPAEVAQLEHSVKGGLSDHLIAIVKSEDGNAILEFFEDFVRKTYGQRSEDGKHFLKSKKMSEEFIMSGAYPVLFMELVTDAEALSDFIMNVLPASLREKVALEQKKQTSEKPTRRDLTAMSKEELVEAMKEMASNKE